MHSILLLEGYSLRGPTRATNTRALHLKSGGISISDDAIVVDQSGAALRSSIELERPIISLVSIDARPGQAVSHGIRNPSTTSCGECGRCRSLQHRISGCSMQADNQDTLRPQGLVQQ